MAGQNPDGASHRSAGTPEFHSSLVLKAEPLSGSRAQENRIVPGELRHGTWQFLEPDVIRIAPVVKVHIRTKYQFQFARRHSLYRDGAVADRRMGRGQC